MQSAVLDSAVMDWWRSAAGVKGDAGADGFSLVTISLKCSIASPECFFLDWAEQRMRRATWHDVKGGNPGCW